MRQQKRRKHGLLAAAIVVLLLGAGACGAAVACGALERDTWAAANGNIRLKQGLYAEPELIESEYGTDEFVNLNIDCGSVGLIIEKGAVEKIGLKYYEDFENQYAVSITDGALKVIRNNKNPEGKGIFQWLHTDFDWVLGFFDGWGDMYNIRVTVPESFEFGDIDVKSANGFVHASGIKAAGKASFELGNGNLDIDGFSAANITGKLFNGKAHLTNITAADISFNMSNGNLYLDKAAVSGGITVDNSNGNADIKESYAASLTAELSNGNLYVSASDIIASELTLLNGKAQFTSLKAGFASAATSFDIRADNGSIKIDGERKRDGNHYKTVPDGATHSIKANLSNGNFLFN